MDPALPGARQLRQVKITLRGDLLTDTLQGTRPAKAGSVNSSLAGQHEYLKKYSRLLTEEQHKDVTTGCKTSTSGAHNSTLGNHLATQGIPIRTTLDNSTTVQYAGLLHQLTMKAKSTVRDIDPQNDLTFLRIRSKKHEIMVAPDKEYLLIVIQNPCE
ncbi:PREDICTED: dynein light chain roadblock-type 2-like [Thamnophis sirtalis]|uniref:Dynein light chain roadblock-type 2-like n=1 Tax=Thamnophis sirtalis TaxID=35019 RepID=A0A6I9XK31_9SAUR|nr:PREDICTED: dynein light chain roadblock-type 2-like [Thamnophis sirtalis]